MIHNFVGRSPRKPHQHAVAHLRSLGGDAGGPSHYIPLYPGISRYIPAYLGSFFLFAGKVTRVIGRATLAAAQQFRRSYFGRKVRPADRREPPSWASVPSDYDAQIRALRCARGLSQAQLATLVGAAHKAVVYQWEARKRTPSPLFWRKITALFVPAMSLSATGARTRDTPTLSPVASLGSAD